MFGSGVPGICTDCEGTYFFTEFTANGEFCQWVWDNGTCVLVIIYCKATATYCARVIHLFTAVAYGGFDCLCGPAGYKDVTPDVFCDGFDLFAFFELDATEVACAGDTIEVSLA